MQYNNEERVIKMLNRCVFMGRLTKDPEIRHTQNNEPVAVARFSIAVDRNYQKDGNKTTDFFEIEAWRQKAEFAEKFLKKGQLISVDGSMQQYSWEDQDGKKRYNYRLIADHIYFADTKKSGQNGHPESENEQLDPFITNQDTYNNDSDEIPEQ